MQDLTNSNEFDFDEWVKLAKEDPDAYENKRKQMIEAIIDDAAPEIKHRMRGLQWQIDQIRSTSPNPMASCLRISQMMWDKVLADDGLLDHMQQLRSLDTGKLDKPRTSATIINMRDSLNKDKN